MPQTLEQLIRENEESLISDWIDSLNTSASFRKELTSDRELQDRCLHFLRGLEEVLRSGSAEDSGSRAWEPLRDQIEELSDSWVELGFSPSELAGFVMLLRPSLIECVSGRLLDQPERMKSEVMLVNQLLDRLGLWAAEIFQSSQQKIIERQQEELMELSTPVISIWKGVVVLPLIGTLDSTRTQVVMESLLERIVEERAQVAILDITGVPTVDTLVAQHLLKAVTATRLMGTECIISGIRPSIAQTMVQLGVDLREVATKSTLADAFEMALVKQGLRVEYAKGKGGNSG